ncbi:MAG TPA: TetR/AcrR family transcriptional regulator [Caulobacteraceae bacterium]|nr:TetR/AcrR family transcriptional regulator [Caulobacteraceae bacterium]
MKSARKAKGAGHLRRGEILHAAERIFVREGYHGATIRKIADEVGVSSTALYMHFRDKSEILLEICEEAFAQLIAQNDAIGDLPLEPVARVRKMLEAYMQFGLANPNAYQLVFASPPGVLSEDKRVAIQLLGMRCFERFVAAVGAVAQAGRLRGDPAAAAQLSWSAAHGLVSLLITQPQFQWTETPERLKALMLDSLFDGLLVA